MVESVIKTVEAHTAGEPFFIVTSGLPDLPGETIVAKRKWLKETRDDIRKALVLEPRGHADMYGGYLTEAVSAEADFGIIIMHNEGYSDHCGHGVIALSAVAVKLGWVKCTVPETKVGIDASCDYIEAHVKWDGSKVGGVRFTNVPSFIFVRDASVITPSFSEVKGDIVFYGAFYFYTSSKPWNIPVQLSKVEALTKPGMEAKTVASEKYKVEHPFIPEINHIYGTIIDNDLNTKEGTQVNVCIFADREVDRSPTGSGTAGRVAQLFLRDKIQKGEYLVNESIIGSIFRGKVIEAVKYEGYDAAVAEIEGSANVLGFASWTIDSDDDIAKGFLVRE